MSQEIINIGTLPNDGEGDPLRVAFAKINNNFTQLFSTSSLTANAYTFGTSPAVIFETPTDTFTQGRFQVRTTDIGTPDSQTITITAQINNDATDVKFTGYGTTFFGNALSSYSMDVFNGNVRLLCEPLSDLSLFHFIDAQITYSGPVTEGIPLQLDGYSEGTYLGTENDQTITTENP